MKINGENASISLYKDSPLRESTFTAGENMLKEVFGNFTDKMSLILLDQAKELGFTNKRFMDAVKYVIKNHKYPNVTIADIVNYDKVINLRTYDQVAKEQKDFGNTIWDYYKKVDIKGKCYYVHIRELDLHGIELPEYKPKPATAKVRTDPGTRYYLSDTFSFKEAFNELVEKTGEGDKI